MVEAKKRILSIDALRGLDMIWLVGLASFFTVLNKAWPNAYTDLMAKQVTHTSVGLHLYDLIFPTFVFLVHNAEAPDGIHPRCMYVADAEIRGTGASSTVRATGEPITCRVRPGRSGMNSD